MMSRQFFVFVAVGFASAVIDVGVMQLLIKSGVHYAASASFGFAISLVFNYFCQARITFKAVSSFGTMVRFGCLVVMNYIITMILVICSQHFFDDALVGKVLSLPVIAVNSFLWSRYWVFSHPSS